MRPDDDLGEAQLLEGVRLARDEDRPVARADASAVRQQRVAVLDRWIRVQRVAVTSSRPSSAHSFSVWMSCST